MEEHQHVKALAPSAKAAWLWRAIKFESVPILVLLFALFYSNGYAYLETYHNALGVPINRLGYDTYQFVVYGGVDVLVKFAAVTIAGAAVAVFTCLMYLTENPDRAPHVTTLSPTTRRARLSRRLSKSYTNAKLPILGTLLLTFLAISTWSLWTFTFSESIARGKLKAYEEIHDCKPSTVQLKNLDVVTGCIVGESSDLLYLIDKHTEGGEILSQERSIPKDSLRSTTGPQQVLKRPE